MIDVAYPVKDMIEEAYAKLKDCGVTNLDNFKADEIVDEIIEREMGRDLTDLVYEDSEDFWTLTDIMAAGLTERMENNE